MLGLNDVMGSCLTWEIVRPRLSKVHIPRNCLQLFIVKLGEREACYVNGEMMLKVVFFNEKMVTSSLQQRNINYSELFLKFCLCSFIFFSWSVNVNI